jgi:hypothetical protein
MDIEREEVMCSLRPREALKKKEIEQKIAPRDDATRDVLC